MRPICSFSVAFLAVLFAGATAFGQSAAPVGPDEALAIAFAQKAAVRALDFQEGDLASLTDAKGDFTPSAWHDFLKQFEGFLDAKGAPQYSSEFEPSGPPAVVRHENGVVTLTIPGKLTQTHLKSRTTYRLVVTIQVSGNPPKIAHLDQTTCGGHSTAPAVQIMQPSTPIRWQSSTSMWTCPLYASPSAPIPPRASLAATRAELLPSAMLPPA